MKYIYRIASGCVMAVMVGYIHSAFGINAAIGAMAFVLGVVHERTGEKEHAE